MVTPGALAPQLAGEWVYRGQNVIKVAGPTAVRAP